MKTAIRHSPDENRSQASKGTRRTISFITSSKESGDSTGSISQRPIAIGWVRPKISRFFIKAVKETFRLRLHLGRNDHQHGEPVSDPSGECTPKYICSCILKKKLSLPTAPAIQNKKPNMLQ